MRKIIILIHLYLAAFIAPAFLLVAVSGGLYLLGVKGQTVDTEITLPAGTSLDFKSDALQSDVDALLDQLDIDHQYQYLKKSGNLAQTRPTSSTYLEFTRKGGLLTLTRKQPDLQKSMIELHKGHGPTAFKTYQKLVALSLIIIVLSGLWLGLLSPSLRSKTGSAFVVGLVLFIVLLWS